MPTKKLTQEFNRSSFSLISNTMNEFHIDDDASIWDEFRRVDEIGEDALLIPFFFVNGN